jgi:hypothetical protein
MERGGLDTVFFVTGIPLSVTGGHADLNPLAPEVPLTPYSNIANTVDGRRKRYATASTWIKRSGSDRPAPRVRATSRCVAVECDTARTRR